MRKPTYLNESSLAITPTTNDTLNSEVLAPCHLQTKRERDCQSLNPNPIDKHTKMNTITLLLSLHVIRSCHSFTVPTSAKLTRHHHRLNSDVKSSDDGEVYGSKFFGGNQVKEELFDVEEEKDGVTRVREEAKTAFYSRFEDVAAFDSDMARDLASRLQMEINKTIDRETKNDLMVNGDSSSIYGSSLVWETPFEKSGTDSPLGTLREAAKFYNKIDVAIIATSFQSNFIANVRWEISLIWPNMWEAKVTFSGTSLVELNDNRQIIKQRDTLNNYEGKDVFKAISDQFFPRFWDFVNIGMSPAAEFMHRVTSDKKMFSPYNLFEIPPRVVLRPSLVDRNGREARNAQMLPMHSFSTAITTTGPQKDMYSTTSPIEVAIKPMKFENGESCNRIEWTIPIAVELSKMNKLPLSIDDSDELMCNYEFQHKRKVATVPFAGDPQDEGITKVRKTLYEAINKDGLRPKLDKNGRPIFFFLMNDVKACFTESGLGMAIYEARPKFGKNNEVGIELEV